MIDKFIKKNRDVKLEVNSLLSRKKNYTCCIPECNKKSILSHSISKSTLKLISKNNHVVAPKFNRARFSLKDIEDKTINLIFENISVERASTFKGFCKDHDNDIFINIDDRGIRTKRDIFLQIYRTACKYYFTDLVHSKAECEVLGYEYYSNSEFDESMPINLAKIKYFCEDILVDFPELDAPVEISNSQTFSTKPFSKKVPLEVEVIYKRINTVFPVALQNCFTLSFEGEFSKSLVIITPDNDSTNLIILCSPTITSQFLSCINSDLNVLNFIESMLMLDSEFNLDRKVVDGWSDEKLEAITNDYYFFDEIAFLDKYDISIFDDIRKKLCLTLSERDRIIELKKIHTIPNRDSIEKRLNKQVMGSIENRHKKLLHTGNTNNKCYPIGSLRIL